MRDRPDVTDHEVESVAMRLHSIMESHDPTDDPDWNTMKEFRKLFYKSCVIELMVSPEMKSVFGIPNTTW